MTYPTLTVEIHFDAGPYAANPASGWTDVTAYVEDIGFQYGKSTFFDEFQPGTGQAILVNDDGRFDPVNAAGPYYGKLLPRRRIRVTIGSPFHRLAYGYIDGWPTEQIWRKQGRCRITWHDALSVLETAPLPDSVWSYHVESTSPFVWYRLDEDKTSVAVDSSGSALPGAYVVDQDLTHTPLPVSILAEGTIDAIIPSSDRSAKNWAKVQQEVGQPLTYTWVYSLRTPVVELPVEVTAALQDRAFTIEAWVRARQAFPIDTPAIPPAPADHALTPIRQPIATWGGPLHSTWFEVGIYTDGSMYIGLKNSAGSYGELFTATDMLDARPHHLSFASYVIGANWLASLFLDGVLQTAVTLGATASTPVPEISLAGTLFQGKGWTATSSDSRGFQSAVSDVIFYDSTRTATPVAASYNAGRYGSLAGSVLTSGEAVDQILDMIDWNGSRLTDAGVKVVDPGVLKGRTALQLMREFASAEQAPLYQSPTGAITMLSRHWSTELTRSRVSQYTLSDASGATLGYEELDYAYDDTSIVNHCTVKWTGGEEVVQDATSITAYGLLDRDITTKLGSAEDARALAEWVVGAYKNPRRRVDRPLRFSPMTDADFAFATDCDFGLRLTLVRTTPDARTVTEDYWVMAVSHGIDKGQGDWVMELTLERADDPFRIFTLDISTLDGPDVLGY